MALLAVHSKKAGNLHQEPCGALAYSLDATVLGTAWMENKWEDLFFFFFSAETSQSKCLETQEGGNSLAEL